LKNDAIKTNYCITIFKQLLTCLKYDAIKTNYCITILGWAGLGWPGLGWPGLGWPGCLILLVCLDGLKILIMLIMVGQTNF
jgi:hypothetical protein